MKKLCSTLLLTPKQITHGHTGAQAKPERALHHQDPRFREVSASTAHRSCRPRMTKLEQHCNTPTKLVRLVQQMSTRVQTTWSLIFGFGSADAPPRTNVYSQSVSCLAFFGSLMKPLMCCFAMWWSGVCRVLTAGDWCCDMPQRSFPKPLHNCICGLFTHIGMVSGVNQGRHVYHT